MGLCLMASCRKWQKKDLIGTWKVTESGSDNNGNKVWDADEKTVYTPPVSYTYTFKDDGSVTMVYADTNVRVEMGETWSLKNRNKVLYISQGFHSKEYNILELTNTTFKTQLDDNDGRSWMTMEKQ